MTKQITIILPETFQVPGMVDAPEHLRSIPTVQWNEEFCLAAIKHGVKQSLQDTWSVGKKDVAKLQKRYDAFVDGDWNQRERTGEGAAKFAAKFDETIKNLNVEALAGKLTREQLFALAALAKADNA